MCFIVLCLIFVIVFEGCGCSGLFYLLFVDKSLFEFYLLFAVGNYCGLYLHICNQHFILIDWLCLSPAPHFIIDP